MENEIVIRLSVFLGLLGLFVALEARYPARARVLPRLQRWWANAGLIVLDTVLLRAFSVIIPALAIGASLHAETRGWGMFNVVDLPVWLEFILVVLIFDFAIWLQHVLTHKIPILWRLHRVHHSDRDVDTTTAIRFHPLEILFSMILKIGLVYVVGPAAMAVLVFEVILNGTALFNHANISLPRRIEVLTRAVIVTPDMHRIHHSVIRHDHDHNFGFSLSIWDRLFGTFLAQASDGATPEALGLEWQDKRPTRLSWLLALPFRK